MDKSELEALLGRIDVWLLIFGVIVVIGVAGESVFGIRHWWNSRKLQKLQQAESDALRSEIARLANETAQANARAAEANQKAEQERLARVRLEATIAPRLLSPKQQKEIIESCRPLAKRGIRVVVETSFTNTLGFQIWSALKEAGFTVELQWTDRALHEVSISGPTEHWDAVTAIEGALAGKIPIIGLTGVLPSGSPIVITVGEKVIGELPK